MEFDNNKNLNLQRRNGTMGVKFDLGTSVAEIFLHATFVLVTIVPKIFLTPDFLGVFWT